MRQDHAFSERSDKIEDLEAGKWSETEQQALNERFRSRRQIPTEKSIKLLMSSKLKEHMHPNRYSLLLFMIECGHSGDVYAEFCNGAVMLHVFATDHMESWKHIKVIDSHIWGKNEQ